MMGPIAVPKEKNICVIAARQTFSIFNDLIMNENKMRTEKFKEYEDKKMKEKVYERRNLLEVLRVKKNQV